MMIQASWLLPFILSFILPLALVPESLAIETDQTTHRLWAEYQRSPATAKLTAPYDRCFTQAAKQQQVPKSLLLAVARGESDFVNDAVSKANAKGIMQINPITARHLNIKQQHLFDPCKNIAAGSRYLKELFARYNSWYLTLAAYNYGPGRIKPGMHHSRLPSGAKWYAAYIYDHLRFVTRTGTVNYQKAQRVTLITYNRPYRARGFVRYLQQQLPGLNFAWFKKPFDQFEVMIVLASEQQKTRVGKQLKALGLEI